MRERKRLITPKKETRNVGTKADSHDGYGWPVFLCLLIFRAVNALMCRTLFVPDEHWQSLEVAYHMTFHRGYLTWEWEKGIRGYTHPLIFAILYKLLVLLGIDSPWMIAESPRLLQSFAAALSDWYLYKLTKLMFSHDVAKYALICQLFSWFTFYCSTRTLSNSLETSLTPVIFYYWLLGVTMTTNSTKNIVFYLLLSAWSVLIRPTGCVLWGPLVAYHLLKHLYPGGKRKEIFQFIALCLIVGVISFTWSILIDRWFYGKWVFVQLEFFKFNFLEGQSAQFGTHPWHWYFSQGLPTVLFTYIPLIAYGLWCCHGNHINSIYSRFKGVPFTLSVVLVVVHSLIKHKEFRFVFPVLPLLSVYTGYGIFQLMQKRSKVLKTIIYCLLIVNIPMSLYFSLVHQRGGYAVMEYLRKDINTTSSVLFLMPCHSTPFYSYLHGEHTMRFLDCSPIGLRSNYHKEDDFYSDPRRWLSSQWYHPPPTHIIMYDVLVPIIKDFMITNSYQQVAKIFHTHIREADRIGHYIMIYKQLKLNDHGF